MTDQFALSPLCNLPRVEHLPLPEGLDDAHTRAIALTQDKWVNGTTITYTFKTVGPNRWPENQKSTVRAGFAAWKALGIGLEFAEVDAEADALLLIGFIQGDGSWSYVGTQVRRYRRHGCNMNFGWDLTTAWGKATVLHEIGHALGMPHEHQNPKSGIEWNEHKVLDKYRREQGWSDEDIRWNILRKLLASEVEGSDWDPQSIMHYPFAPGLIRQPSPYETTGTPANTVLSPGDIRWMRQFYPAITIKATLPVNQVVPLSKEAAAQSDFLFVPEESREYRLQAVGEADLRIALAEAIDEGQSRMLAVADDSATPENAVITRHLERGKTYRIHARTRYGGTAAGPGLKIQ